MSEQDTRGASDDYRPLPAHPDVKFEKKRAKRLLRDATSGDADALRAMARVADGVPPEALTLALAQLAVAREYGFSSWVKLTQYYARWDVVTRTRSDQRHERSYFDSVATWIRNGQAQRIPYYGQVIATWLPRLYGARNDAVFASPISEDEARIIVARQRGCSSWDELQTRRARPDIKGKTVEERRAELEPERLAQEGTPEAAVYRAMRTRNLAELEALVSANPRFLGDFESVYGGRTSLISQALGQERRGDESEARQMVDWLVERGVALKPALDRMLTKHVFSIADVEYWIQRGADPDATLPSGLTTIEHALLWYNISRSQPEAIEILLRHVNRIPRKLWVAAGVGDIKGFVSYFERGWHLTPEGRRDRIDFAALGLEASSMNPDADDETILFEALTIAVLNGRTNVLQAAFERGFPVDAAPENQTLLHYAVGCASVPSVEFLLSRGADPDAPQLWNRSPRWLALEMKYEPIDPAREQIRELLKNAPAHRTP